MQLSYDDEAFLHSCVCKNVFYRLAENEKHWDIKRTFSKINVRTE